MEPTDRISEGLAQLAGTIDVDATAGSLANVRGVASRRRRRRLTVMGFAASAVLVSGGIVAVNMTGNDDGGVDSLSIGAPETTAAVSESGDEPADSSEAVGSQPLAEDDPVEVVSPAATADSESVDPVGGAVSASVDGPSASFEDGFIEWLVPWDDGFLAGRSIPPAPQALPEELPPEVVELFSPEVVALFEDGLPPTINEATQMLIDAGLYDEVAAVVAEHPDANDAIFAEPVSAPTYEVVYSVDGDQWDTVEFVSPDGFQYVRSVQAAGDRLVMMSQLPPDVEPSDSTPFPAFRSGPIGVATSTDLVNWDITTIEHDLTAEGLPDFIISQLFPQSIAVNDDGWVLSAHSNIDIDVRQVLSTADLDLLETSPGGYYSDFTEDGVVVVVEGPYTDVFNDAGEIIDVRPESREEIPLTWAELGVSEEVALTLREGGRAKFWSAPWGGAPVPVEGTQAYSIVGSTDGFYGMSMTLEFSLDGVSWTQLELPEESIGPSALLPIDGGVIAFLGGQDDVRVYRVSGAAGTWEALDVPGLPTSWIASVTSQEASSPAIIIDATPPRQPEPFSVDIEHDGFIVTLTNDGPIFSVTLVGPDGAVLVDETVDPQEVRDNVGIVNYTESGIEVEDPATGDVLATFPSDVVSAAYAEQQPAYEAAETYDPDLWLLATTDGERWLIDDIDESGEYFGLQPPALNGDTLLVGVGGEWMTYDLS